MLLVAPRVNIASSHVVRRDVRAPNKIGTCQNNHRLTSVSLLGGALRAHSGTTCFFQYATRRESPAFRPRTRAT